MGECKTSCSVTVTQAMEEPKFTSLLRSAKAVEGSPIKGLDFSEPTSDLELSQVKQEIERRIKEKEQELEHLRKTQQKAYELADELSEAKQLAVKGSKKVEWKDKLEDVKYIDNFEDERVNVYSEKKKKKEAIVLLTCSGSCPACCCWEL